MSVEIMLPFQIGDNGAVATLSDPALIVDQHVESLITTTAGERIMLPTYGLSLAGLVFGNNDPVLLNVIKNDVTNAFARWEPSITIQNVNPSQSTDAQAGIAAVDVQYTLTHINATGTAVSPLTKTATKTVGGTVVSN